MRYCNWQAISATRSDRLISLVLKAHKGAASRLYQVVWRRRRDDHFSASQTSLRKITAAFSPPAAGISSEDPSASRVQRQKRSKNAVFRGVRMWNKDCSCLTARGDRIALLPALFFAADTRRPEINDPERCATLATCESEAQLNICTSVGSQSSPVR